MEDAIDVGPDDLSSGDAETLISSAIAGLNSDDIESFQILKDGSATSIYGARAMAGEMCIRDSCHIARFPKCMGRVLILFCRVCPLIEIFLQTVERRKAIRISISIV